MKARTTLLLSSSLLLACGDDGDDTCDRYKAYSSLMSRLDPQIWVELDRCPSDAEIAAKGWPQTTLAECVALLEQRCVGVDVDACNRRQAFDETCSCEIGLGEHREYCAPF